MLIACSTCSGPSGISRSLGERIREPQRKQNPLGPVNAKPTVANLPFRVKPVIVGKATSVCVRRTVRGVRVQRAEQDLSGTWESRTGGLGSNVAAEYIRRDRPVRKSDTPIVATKRVTTVERRGVAVDPRPTSQGVPLG